MWNLQNSLSPLQTYNKNNTGSIQNTPLNPNSYQGTPQFMDENKNDESDDDNLSRDFELLNADKVTQRQTLEDVNKLKRKREPKDFTTGYQDDRNILHRTALEQNKNIIADVLSEYKYVLQQSLYSEKDIQANVVSFINMEKEIQANVVSFINQQDKFGLTAVYLCCIINNEIDNKLMEVSSRYQCILELHNQGATLNVYNRRTLWRPINWCAYYGDLQSCQYLIQQRAFIFIPDYKGNYCLDLAAQNNHRSVAELFVVTILNQLEQFEKFKNHQLQSNNDEDFILYQDIFNEHKSQIENPILIAKLLYWSCHLNLNFKLVEKILELPRVYFNCPLYSLKQMTALQAVSMAQGQHLKDFSKKEQIHQEAQQNSKQIIDLMFNLYLRHKPQYQKLDSMPTLEQNNVFSMDKNEQNIYKSCFKKEILLFAQWEWDKQMLINQQITSTEAGAETEAETRNKYMTKSKSVDFEQSKINEFDISHQDSFGNTALHLASIKGNDQIVKILLDYKADMEVENKEFFKARELTQNNKVEMIYKERIDEQNKTRNSFQEEIKACVDQIIENIQHTKQTEQQSRKNSLLRRLCPLAFPQTEEDDSINSLEHKKDKDEECLKRLSVFTKKIFVPDFVIKCKLQHTEPYKQSLFSLINQDTAELQRLNFQINMLKKAKFEIYLMKSYVQKGCYYIMLRHTEANLEEWAQKLKLQVKLMDSYDLEPFEIEIQDLFEPFRSRQRQEIIEGHIKSILNLDQLIIGKTIKTFYRMHNSGGIQIIEKYWLDDQKWYWPQPFTQMKDYFQEGQYQNFGSLTRLRLYLGEKVSFYFAWKSYVTCALVVVAIPGLFLQIYILITDDFNNDILPYWVFYVCLWSTFQVEFWKRKTAELVTRWGCLDLLDDTECSTKVIHHGFKGYEMIYDVTGELTKHQNKTKTYKFLFGSTIVLTMFVGLSITIFILIEQLKQDFSSVVLNTSASILQSIAILGLNIMYTKVAKYYADQENHKYEAEYERSLIYKNVVFKFINSYLPIFYFMFRTDKTNAQIFYLLLPILILKQLNYMALDIILPQLYQQWKQNEYFNQIDITIKAQDKDHKKFIRRQRGGPRYAWFDPLQAFWQNKVTKLLQTSSRAIVKVPTDENLETNTPLESQLNADAVELNSILLDFNGTLDYYTESVIDYGYITLFAAAFPIGPFIALLVSVPEIRMKIYKFLYVYKRSKCERIGGIGEWMNIIEAMSIFSVFSNFTLLFMKQKEKLYNSESLIAQYKDLEIWLTFLSIVVLLLLKELVKFLIPDRPEWVIQEIENMKAKKKRENSIAIGNQILNSNLRAEESKKKYVRQRKRIKSHQVKQKQIQIQKQGTIERLQREYDNTMIQYSNRTQDIPKFVIMKTIGKNKRFANEYDMIVLGVLKQKYTQYEGQLQLKRLHQILKLSSSVICLCQDCNKKAGQVECQTCNMNQCMSCYRQIHELEGWKHKVMLLNEVSTYDKADLQNLKIVCRRDEFQSIKFQVDSDTQHNVTEDMGPKSFKKFQYFSLPTNQISELYHQIRWAYEALFNEYMVVTDIHLKQYTIDLHSIFGSNQLKCIHEPQPQSIISQQNVQNLSINNQSFMELQNLNIEEKLFINRIAFLTFKRLRHRADFQKFESYIKILQHGLLEQRILLLVEMLDVGDDDIITLSELERLIYPSFIQDITMQKKSKQMLISILPKDKQKVQKKLLAQILLGLCEDANYREFFTALLQEK